MNRVRWYRTPVVLQPSESSVLERTRDEARREVGRQNVGDEAALYRLYWKDGDGGHSVASVGRTYEGYHWFAPANWINAKASHDWASVERVELIERSPH